MKKLPEHKLFFITSRNKIGWPGSVRLKPSPELLEGFIEVVYERR